MCSECCHYIWGSSYRAFGEGPMHKDCSDSYISYVTGGRGQGFLDELDAHLNRNANESETDE